MNPVCKMVLVDDDEIIREGLIRNIPWSDHGVELAGSARNGLEGLELAKAEHPQVILSDIRMPFMNGLDMAEAVREILPQTKVVFLTGYDDFEYIKQALNLKVTDYILKYSDNDDILKAVLKAAMEWQRESQLKWKAEKGEIYLKEKIFSELILGNEKLTKIDTGVLEIDGEESRFSVAVVRLNTLDEPQKGRGRLLTICRKLLQKCVSSGECIPVNLDIVIIFWLPISREAPIEYLEKDLNGLFEQFQLYWTEQIRMGVGKTYLGFDNIAKSYQEALTAIASQGIHQPNEVTFYSQIHDAENYYRLRKIVAYVEQNFADPDLTLAKVGEEINICPAYISTIFKRYQQFNFSDFLISIRMENARKLLEKTNLMTYEIAEKSGYTNPQYFSVLFKKYTGCTPTEYKNAHFQNDDKFF